MKPQNIPGMSPQNPLKVNPDDLPDKYCKKCGTNCRLFMPIFALKHIPVVFRASTGQNQAVVQVGWICLSCHGMNTLTHKGEEDEGKEEPTVP